MAGVTVRVSFDAQPLQATMRALQGSGPAQQAMAAFGKSILESVQICFRTGTDPWGARWQPIRFRSPKGESSTRAQREQVQANQRGTPGQPLRDTGRLLTSLSLMPDNGAMPGVRLGTVVRYARTHQFGAVIQGNPWLSFRGPHGGWIRVRQVTVPARPFLPLRGGLAGGGASVDLPAAWADRAVTRAVMALERSLPGGPSR